MKEIVLEAFRHHAWANKQLLATCRGLSHEQLMLPGTAAGTDAASWRSSTTSPSPTAVCVAARRAT
jgi:hypothetical protein